MAQAAVYEPVETSASANLSSRLAVPLALLSLYVIWGSTYLAIRFAVETIPPFYMAAARFLLAGGILFVVLRVRGYPVPRRKEWLGAFAVGALLLGGGNGLVGLAEQHVASGLSAVIIATVPLWAGLFAGLWGYWPTRVETLGLVLGFAGIVVLNTGTALNAYPVDALILVIAAFSWAFGSVWSRHLPLPKGIMASAAEMLCGGVVLVFEGLFTGEHMTALPSAKSLWAVAYLIVFGSMVGFVAYSFLLRSVRPALATSYAYVNPAIALLLGTVLAGEHVSPLTMLALALIVTAVALVISSRERTVIRTDQSQRATAAAANRRT